MPDQRVGICLRDRACFATVRRLEGDVWRCDDGHVWYGASLNVLRSTPWRDTAAVHHVGECTVTIDRDDQGPFVVTRFSDGAECMARPSGDEPTDEPPIHDLLHSLIAEARGEQHSKALWNLAHPDMQQYHPADVAAEEARVLRFQEMLPSKETVDGEPRRCGVSARVVNGLISDIRSHCDGNENPHA